MTKFLVTGASGYIAMHIIDTLLKEGHQVRGTVRDLNDSKKVLPIQRLGNNSKFPLELVEAELLDAESWNKALENIEIVMHVATPVITSMNEDEVIKPAVEGTINVLNAAFKANVKKFIYTSSSLTISGYSSKNKTYNEEDWAELDNLPTPYGKSKILAEREVWNFIEDKSKKKQKCFEVSVIHPSLTLGPVLSGTAGLSISIFLNLLEMTQEKRNNLYLPCCDVRDVALAHVRAAFLPEAIGFRHLIVSSKSLISQKEWVEIFNNEFQSKGLEIKNDFNLVSDENPNSVMDNSRMINVLGIIPTDFKKTIIDMTNSLIEFGLVKA